MMTCRELAELLMDFVENDLAQEMCHQVEEHLRACPPCVVFVETYRVTIHLSRRLPCGELPEHLRCRCEEMLREHEGDHA